MQIGLAIHNYNDTHGQLPPPAVCGKDGQPLLSWRVELLPFFECQELYSEFHLDEPWDSPHNIQLLPRMPVIYAPPGRKKNKAPPSHTFCHVFVGEGTAFEGPGGMRIADDFPDGTSNTILVIEGGQPVPWTKPQETPYPADEPLPQLATVFKDSFRVALADGSMRPIATQVSEKTLRAAITRNGGETVSGDWHY